jgi:carboxypeptidase Taq
MLKGDLNVAEIPEAWDTRFKSYLGLDVPDAAMGCLQDVHWSCGLIGYFPTYALGNMYAAQFFEQAHKDLPGLDDMLARGEFKPLLEWLRKHIHQHGRRYRGRELAQRITGKPISPNALLDHLERRAKEYYGV